MVILRWTLLHPLDQLFHFPCEYFLSNYTEYPVKYVSVRESSICLSTIINHDEMMSHMIGYDTTIIRDIIQ